VRVPVAHGSSVRVRAISPKVGPVSPVFRAFICLRVSSDEAHRRPWQVSAGSAPRLMSEGFHDSRHPVYCVRRRENLTV
jgi:hypothetical protein